MQEFVTHSREETVAVGRELAKTLPAGALIAFTGGLGAGKTAFCQGLAEGLGCTDPVSSPTFAIVNYYRVRGPLRILIYTASTPRATWPPPDSTTTSTWGLLSPASGARTARSCWIWKIPFASTLNGWTRRRGRSRLGKASAAVGVGVLDIPGAVRLPHGCGGMRACRPTHYFSTGCRAGCPHPAGTLPLQPIYGQSQYTRPSSALGRGLGHLQSPR